MRRMPVSVSSGVLTFWMLLITLLVNGVAALLIEGPLPRAPMMGEWLAILYNAVIVFAVCHIAWFSIARELPPVASGLSIMMIPVLGVFSGAWWLGEPLGWPELSALGLILVAIATVVLPGKAGTQPKAR
jgi:drug/metabolite transporter (DMT)-like permease